MYRLGLCLYIPLSHCVLSRAPYQQDPVIFWNTNFPPVSGPFASCPCGFPASVIAWPPPQLFPPVFPRCMYKKSMPSFVQFQFVLSCPYPSSPAFLVHCVPHQEEANQKMYADLPKVPSYYWDLKEVFKQSQGHITSSAPTVWLYHRLAAWCLSLREDCILSWDQKDRPWMSGSGESRGHHKYAQAHKQKVRHSNFWPFYRKCISLNLFIIYRCL